MECPRWRLTEPHYINVPTLPDGTKVEWEHKEMARESGRAVRKLFAVPMLLDPKDPADHNYPGEIIVARDVDGARHQRGDLIFLGDPTPAMEPLNDEAQAITDALRPRWEHPIETLPVNGGMNESEMAFFQNMMAQFGKMAQAAPAAENATVPRSEFDALKQQLEELKAALVAKPAEAPSVARRA